MITILKPSRDTKGTRDKELIMKNKKQKKQKQKKTPKKQTNKQTKKNKNATYEIDDAQRIIATEEPPWGCQ